jgi:molecular chaperone GrpE
MTQNQSHPHPLDDESEEVLSTEDVAELEADAAIPPGEEDPVSLLQAELAETKERMLRALADTENLRRRSSREVDDVRKYAITGFAREMLEIADNLARALECVPDELRSEESALGKLVEGVELTQRSLANCFERQRIVKLVPEIGEKFDHNLHQAMFETETDQQAPGTVTQVMQPGYMIAERLLRPAMVGVAKRPAAKPEAGPAPDTRGQQIDTTA